MRNFSPCPIRASLITLGILLLLLPAEHNATATRLKVSRAAHIERGTQVARRYEFYGRRLAAYYNSLAAAVKEGAPELLAHLQPRGPVLHGYQVLPPLLLNAPAAKSPATTLAYSWPWTDQLIDRALQKIAQSETELGHTKTSPRQNRQVLERLALDYARLSSERANIHAHIQYNRLWQSAIAADRAGYDQETTLQNEVFEYQKITDRLRRMSAASERSSFTHNTPLRLTGTSVSLATRAASLTQRIDAALSQVTPPNFINVENHNGAWIIRVPLVTDIEDDEFVQTVKQVIEDTWRISDPNKSYRVQLDVTFISPQILYGDKPMGGQKLDLRRHLERFPPGAAILTTGGLTTYVQDFAIILGAQGITPLILAHEFGHILGFRDRYVRGYKNLGEDGFLVMERIVDPEDIMAATPYGAVFPRHFERLIDQVNPRIIPASKLHALPRRKPKLLEQ